jgi:hypothetical protein
VSAGIVQAAEAAKDKEDAEAGVTAPEDLMREHGVLNRILLIYEEGLRRLPAQTDIPPDIFHTSASLARKFVEDYHEKLFGEGGFDKMVGQVAAIEKKLGIYDLARFTPP